MFPLVLPSCFLKVPIALKATVEIFIKSTKRCNFSEQLRLNDNTLDSICGILWEACKIKGIPTGILMYFHRDFKMLFSVHSPETTTYSHATVFSPFSLSMK